MKAGRRIGEIKIGAKVRKTYKTSLYLLSTSFKITSFKTKSKPVCLAAKFPPALVAFRRRRAGKILRPSRQALIRYRVFVAASWNKQNFNPAAIIAALRHSKDTAVPFAKPPLKQIRFEDQSPLM